MTTITRKELLELELERGILADTILKKIRAFETHLYTTEDKAIIEKMRMASIMFAMDTTCFVREYENEGYVFRSKDGVVSVEKVGG